MASTAHDDGFHEIQLNGKQLVFLFMAVTVVSIVIFLCGVLVGRGVQLDRGGVVEAMAADAEGTAPPPIPASAAGTATEPVAGLGEVTYPNRLEGSAPPSEKLTAGDAPPAKAEPLPEPAAPAPDPVPPTPAAAAAPGEPAGPGLAIQVAAFRDRPDADRLAQQLIGKGYKAYVVGPNAGAPGLFRVRVGKFKEQREADSVAARLTREEQFKPWIVR